jgi:hypothetical protein
MRKRETTKKVIGIIVCMLLCATVLPLAGTVAMSQINGDHTTAPPVDIMKPSGAESKPLNIAMDSAELFSEYGQRSGGNYPVPQYEFIKEPITIMKSYYDYMPSGYTTYPIQLQTEHGNGQYITFHAKPASTGNRRQYYAYVNNTYGIQSGTISPFNQNEGYGSIAIHPATGDAIASWHEATAYTTRLTYDNYDATETPGAWKPNITVPTTSGMQYIWPVMYVGPSPQGAGYVRVYQVCTNAKQLPSTLPCEDVRIMYTDVPDVNGADLSTLLNLTTWHTVTVFTDWRDMQCRPFQSFAIDYNHPGKVAFIGVATWLGDTSDIDEGAFVWESLDYGETWDYANFHTDGPGAALYKVNNPGFDGAPAQLDVTAAGYHNTALYDAEGNLHWTYMQSYGYSDDAGSYYFPSFLPQAEMVWNGTGFSFHEVPQLSGIDSLSGHSVPWTDGEHLYPTVTWSTYPVADAGIFHENTQKQASNPAKHWLVQMWADGTYATLGADNPEYAAYINHPIIYLTVSSDDGKTWSDPIQLTDIYNDKFDFSQQITVYPYICDKITDLGNNWGQIYITYFDDNSFGSSVQGSGSNTGGNITYCSLKIRFYTPNELVVNPGGPYSAETNEHIQFVGSAFGGTPPYAWSWNFGDGTTSTEQNPTHAYTSSGTKTVTLSVTDNSNPPLHGSANTTATITEPPCFININISGGFGLTITVNNTGTEDIANLSWKISLNGSMVFPKEKQGSLPWLVVGRSEVINLKVFGIGKITITVNTGCADKTTTGFVFLFFVLGVK